MMERLDTKKLIQMINKTMKCDLTANNRKRENVDGRMMFSVIAHNEPYMLKDAEIANYFGVDRTTVIHYRKVMSFNIKKSMPYIQYYNEIIGNKSVDNYLNDDFYREEVKKLREIIDDLKKENESMKVYRDAWKRAPRFHSYIDERFWEDVTEDELNVIKYLLRDVKKKRTRRR